jgi:ferredoxin
MPIITKDCISCGMCLEECPVGAIEVNDLKTIEKGYAQSIINQSLCIDCKTCIDKFECPANAIREK